jgi:tetratricopeptide (TPR) repeat protein
MSYINDALRKAQRERDGRYERFGGIIAGGSERPKRPRRRRIAVGAAVMLLALVSAGLYLWIDVLKQSSPAPQVLSSPAVAGNPVAVRTSRPKAAENAVPAGAVTAGAKRQETPGNRTALREAEGLYQQALLVQRRGDLPGAEEAYRKVLALDPGNVRALNNLGVVYMGQKRRAKAIAVFGRAMVLKKDYVDPYYNLACLYAQANELHESLWYLKVAMGINGDVKKWAEKDADLKNIVASPAFKKMMEGQ